MARSDPQELHTAAQALGDAGEPLKIVSELLQRANISTTANLYRQAGADTERAAQGRMNKLFAA